MCVCVQEETQRGLPLQVADGPHAPAAAAAAAAEHTQDKRIGEEEEEVIPLSVTHSLSFVLRIQFVLCNIPLSHVQAVGCVFFNLSRHLAFGSNLIIIKLQPNALAVDW